MNKTPLPIHSNAMAIMLTILWISGTCTTQALIYFVAYKKHGFQPSFRYLYQLASSLFMLNVAGGSVVLPAQITLHSAHGPSIVQATKVALYETLAFVSSAFALILIWIFLDKDLDLSEVFSSFSNGFQDIQSRQALFISSLVLSTVVVIYIYRKALKGAGLKLSERLQDLKFPNWSKNSETKFASGKFISLIVICSPFPWILEGLVLSYISGNFGTKSLTLLSSTGIIVLSYLVGLASMIPGAWGARDVTLAALLTIYGFTAKEALLISVTMRALKTSVSIAYSLFTLGYMWKFPRRT